MWNIDECNIGINCKDHPLHDADIMIFGPEVGQQGNDLFFVHIVLIKIFPVKYNIRTACAWIILPQTKNPSQLYNLLAEFA